MPDIGACAFRLLIIPTATFAIITTMDGILNNHHIHAKSVGFFRIVTEFNCKCWTTQGSKIMPLIKIIITKIIANL